MERLTTTNGNRYIQLKIGNRYVRISDLDMLQVAKKLKEYEDLEEQGKLLKFPCKIGDKIYHIENNQMKEFVVYSFDIKPLQMFACNDEGKRINLKQFGKTAFLSKEEAELHIKAQEEKDASAESLIKVSPHTCDFSNELDDIIMF